jgi:hypothetical protein
MVTHRNVVRLVRNTNYVDFSPALTIGHVSNVAFDASTFEIWGALLNGCRLAVIPKMDVLAPADFAAFVASTAPPASKPTPVWGVELVGGSTDENALAAYRRLEQKYASILAGRQAFVVHHGLGRGSMGWAHVRVGADNRPTAEKLCVDLRGAGVSYCEVQRTTSAR